MNGNRITGAEWPIMEALWNGGTQTAAEIVAAVTARTGTSMRTVKTLLRRLVAKGAVGYTVDAADARVYHYTARVRREDCAAVRTEAVLDTVFAQDAGEMLLHFVRDTRLSRAEIERLEALLAEKREELEKKDG